ncbi:type II toxin-antitoxin system RelE/ParE family toxin [Novosphingobium sediminicola]|uniref:Toxin ParE1/3/4 n=1 Tax=Novosphingobium sediminicola TaxID=563162 RepID=A0A7W6CDW9_9SPHN|nr:type II toxin-antitoxin system RelE/ParE family toxin [Novosphingobium sediminicola]MBB3954032.1 toxin ParE1/3/4 [Novosphingobium sediminicola]
MPPLPVVPRARALEDIEQAVDHYAQEAGPDTAYAFIDALEQAYGFIAAAPGAGSTRWAHDLNLPGLRTVRLKGFPWLVFYMGFATHIDVWRVLHVRRDMAAWMDDEKD